MGERSQHSRALEWALAQVGKQEVPAGSNRGPFVQFCQRATWLGGTGWAWCRAFTLRARIEGGNKPEDGSAGAWDALERARKRGQALPPSAYHLTSPGDEVILNVGSGHACMLRGVGTVGGQVVLNCVDGNWGDRVALTQHSLSTVRGFIHWPEHPAVKPEKRPHVQVVGGASGKKKLVTRHGFKLPIPQFRLVRRDNGLVYTEPVEPPH